MKLRLKEENKDYCYMRDLEDGECAVILEDGNKGDIVVKFYGQDYVQILGGLSGWDLLQKQDRKIRKLRKGDVIVVEE